MSELTKLNKIIKKLEKKYEKVGPLEKKRIEKKFRRTEARVKFLSKRR